MKKDNLQDAMKDIDPRLVREASGNKRSSSKTLVGISVSVLSIVLVAAIVMSAVLLVPGTPKNNNTGNTGRLPQKNDDVLVIPGPSNGLSFGEKLGDGVVTGSPGHENPGDRGDIFYDASEGLEFGGEGYEGEIPMPVEAPAGVDSGKSSEGWDVPESYVIRESNISAGTLTAAEWRDRDNLKDWFSLINENSWNAYLSERRLYSNRVIKVHVADGDNVCFNVEIEALAEGKVLAVGRTDINGDAVLAYDILGNLNVKPDAVRILGKETAIEKGATEISVDVSSEEGYDKPYKLDLMFMIDTTGSMGDELRYIEAELSDMVKRVSESGNQLSIRVSVNFYRDEYDDYIVKYYDFREDIRECIGQIEQEIANGGGDMPEAVHKALSNAVTGHEWRADAVKLCFLVLDAPPHTEAEVQGIGLDIANSLVTASGYGIRIIPVYCSSEGGNETEFILRSYALVTGGTFIFLTDDSGIGYSHATPTVSSEYDVEFLNECMIRVTCEYMGLEYSAPEKPVVEDNGSANEPNGN